jgi:hypothetical protein
VAKVVGGDSRFREEEEAQDKHDRVRAELYPINPVPVGLESDPVRDERSGRVGGKDGQDEERHCRTSCPLRPQIGDDSCGRGTFDAGGGTLDPPAEDERVNVRSQGLPEKEEHDAARENKSIRVLTCSMIYHPQLPCSTALKSRRRLT